MIRCPGTSYMHVWGLIADTPLSWRMFRSPVGLGITTGMTSVFCCLSLSLHFKLLVNLVRGGYKFKGRWPPFHSEPRLTYLDMFHVFPFLPRYLRCEPMTSPPPQQDQIIMQTGMISRCLNPTKPRTTQNCQQKTKARCFRRPSHLIGIPRTKKTILP